MLSQFSVAALDPFASPVVSARMSWVPSDGFLKGHLAESDTQMQWNGLDTVEGVSARRPTQKIVSGQVQPTEAGKSTNHKYMFLPVYKLQWNEYMSTNTGADYGLTKHCNGTTDVRFRHAQSNNVNLQKSSKEQRACEDMTQTTLMRAILRFQ